MFLYSIYFGALSVMLPFIGASFGLGPAAEGRLFPANFGGFVGGVLVCGYLSDRWGRKAVLLLGIAIYALGLTLFGAAPTFALALLASALVGAGSGAMEAVASALVSDLYPGRRASILNAIQVAFGAGAAFSPTLAHALLMNGTDWRRLYFGLAVANMALFLVLAVQSLPRSTHGSEALNFAALRAVLRQPAFGALCLAQAIYVGAETGFFSWMPTYFEKRLPGGAAWAGLVVTVFWIAMTIGRMATGGLLGRIPLLCLTMLLSLGGAAGSALALLGRSPLAVMTFVALTGLLYSGIFGLILAEAGERFPEVAGTVFGGVVAAGGFGGALIPWAIGALAATPLDWRGALWMVPILSVSIAALAQWLRTSRPT
jgi:FHS family glucose/mannose:H+ symporter-like MFS transporter